MSSFRGTVGISFREERMAMSKAKVLETLDESARVHDVSLAKNLDIAAHPEQHGWRRSLLTAFVVVPLTGISATLNDLARVCVAHSDDNAWGQGELPSPPTPPAQTPPTMEDNAS
jgi:hypothetical protein